jgi:hypothetical protein
MTILNIIIYFLCFRNRKPKSAVLEMSPPPSAPPALPDDHHNNIINIVIDEHPDDYFGTENEG